MHSLDGCVATAVLEQIQDIFINDILQCHAEKEKNPATVSLQFQHIKTGEELTLSFSKVRVLDQLQLMQGNEISKTEAFTCLLGQVVSEISKEEKLLLQWEIRLCEPDVKSWEQSQILQTFVHRYLQQQSQ